MMNLRFILAADTPVSGMAHNTPKCKTSRACDVQSISHVMHLRYKNLHKLLKVWHQILEFSFKEKSNI